MKRVALVVVVAGVTAVAVPASAQDAPQNMPPAQPVPEQAKVPPARYRFERVAGNFLRFDNVTGQIMLCSPQAVGWACQAVPEVRASTEKEIGRLQQEVVDLKQQLAQEMGDLKQQMQQQVVDLKQQVQQDVVDLKQQVAALRPPPPPRPPAPIPPAVSNPPASDEVAKLVMPTHEDIEHAKAFIADAWRRVVDMIVNIQKEAMRRG